MLLTLKTDAFRMPLNIRQEVKILKLFLLGRFIIREMAYLLNLSGLKNIYILRVSFSPRRVFIL